MNEETSDDRTGRSDTGSALQRSIEIDLCSDLSGPARQGLSLLFESLSPFWNDYPVSYLAKVLIMPQSQIPDTVKALVREIEGCGLTMHHIPSILRFLR